MVAGTLDNTIVQGKQTTIYERLVQQKKNLEKSLDEVNKALELLKENPKIKEVLEALSKITHIY